MASSGLLPGRMLVKSANSFSGTFHGAKDRDESGEQPLLYLQSFCFNGAGRQDDYYGFVLPPSKLYDELIYFLQAFLGVDREENLYVLLDQDDVNDGIPYY